MEAVCMVMEALENYEHKFKVRYQTTGVFFFSTPSYFGNFSFAFKETGTRIDPVRVLAIIFQASFSLNA